MSAISGTIGAIIGGNAQEKAAGKAAKSSERIAKMQADLVRELYEQGRSDMLPFIKAGHKAIGDLQNFDATGGAGEHIERLMALTFPDGVDPTGGMQKYMDELESLEFEFDENDPVYQWRQKENQRRIDQFSASRGGYDSRAAANMLMESGMQLQGQEVDRQFNQRYLAKYNKLRDLAGLSLTKGQAEYGAAKDKYGADVARELTGYNAKMQMGATGYNQLADLVKFGTGAGATAGGFGQSASNQLSNIYGQMSQDQQNAILQQGASQAQMWNNLGQQSNNALMTYLAFMK